MPTTALLLILLAAGAEPADLVEANALLAQKRFQEAARAFERVYEDSGRRCTACLIGLGHARLRLGNLGAARKSGEQAVEQSGEDRRARAAGYNLIGLARTLEAHGRSKYFEKAEVAFRAAVAADPSDTDLRFNLGRALLQLGRDDEGRAELQAFLEQATGGPIDIARSYLDNPRRARQRFAPDFRLTTTEGEVISLETLSGRTLVLDFWATWCGPCVKSIPELRDLREEHPPEKLLLLSVSVDRDEEKWSRFVQEKNMTWPQYRDADQRLTESFGVQGFPTYLVIDAEGAVVKEIVGLNAQRTLAGQLRKELKLLFAPNP